LSPGSSFVPWCIKEDVPGVYSCPLVHHLSPGVSKRTSLVYLAVPWFINCPLEYQRGRPWCIYLPLVYQVRHRPLHSKHEEGGQQLPATQRLTSQSPPHLVRLAVNLDLVALHHLRHKKCTPRVQRGVSSTQVRNTTGDLTKKRMSKS
jgi:hypothetical protein